MTIHYHGTPISPRRVLNTLAGKHFCVSFAAPQDIEVCHKIGQSVMLDNGAFSVWKRDMAPDWPGYYRWCEKWLAFPTTWAVIPDIIDGDEKANFALARSWPFFGRGAAVWHLHESLNHLLHLAHIFPRICFGSSGQYAEIGTARWHGRVTEAWNTLAREHRLLPWVHMLRGMSLAGSAYPFASLDSTDVARNHNRPHNSARKMADLWDAQQCPGTWADAPVQLEMA